MKVNNAVFNLLPEIGTEAWSLLVVLLSKYGSKEGFTVSKEELKKKCGLGDRKITFLLARLLEKGILSTERDRIRGRLQPYRYSFAFENRELQNG